MANDYINKITATDGTTYDIKDTVSGYTTNTGTVTGMTTTAGSHTAGTQTVTNGIITTNIPTKTSHLTNDSGFITTDSDEKLKTTSLSAGTTSYLLSGPAETTAANKYYIPDITAYRNGSGPTYLTVGSASGAYAGGLGLANNGTSKGQTIINPSATSNIILTLPDATGTIALTSDIPSVTDTKNTAGSSSKTGTKMYLIGATSQDTYVTTYSNANCYIDASNNLYSNGRIVVTPAYLTENEYAQFDDIPTKTSQLTNDRGFITSADLPSFVSGVKGNSESSYRTGNVNLTPANIGAVPTSRTVNSKALSSNITLTASDVSAVPTTRKVNNKALSSDITLSASDVSAVPTTRTVNSKALSSNIALTASDVSALPTDFFIWDPYSQNITVPGSGGYNFTMGTLTQHSGYTLRGYINKDGGYTDQWLVSYGTYGSNVVAMVYSKYGGSLTKTISCTAIWTKNL